MCTSSGAHVHLGSAEAALCRPLKLGLQPLHPAQDSNLQGWPLCESGGVM